MEAVERSDAFRALGSHSARDAIASIVDLIVSLEMVSGTRSLDRLLVAMMSNRWWIDESIDNTVTMAEPERTVREAHARVVGAFEGESQDRVGWAERQIDGVEQEVACDEVDRVRRDRMVRGDRRSDRNDVRNPGTGSVSTLESAGDDEPECGLGAPGGGRLGGFSTVETLRPGRLVDRFGPNTGRFVSPAGTPFSARGLPPELARERLQTFEILQPLNVEGSIASPAFGGGLGVQYRLPAPVQALIDAGVLGVK